MRKSEDLQFSSLSEKNSKISTFNSYGIPKISAKCSNIYLKIEFVEVWKRLLYIILIWEKKLARIIHMTYFLKKKKFD